MYSIHKAPRFDVIPYYTKNLALLQVFLDRLPSLCYNKRMKGGEIMKTTYKKHLYRLTVAAMCLALALTLPFLTMQLPEIGNLLLPMHLPIFLCGILAGAPYGALVGALAPLLRSLLFMRPILYPTALSMSFELCAYGVLVGLFVLLLRKKTPKTLYLSLIGAMLGGRVVWAIARVFMLALDEIPFSFSIFLTEGFVTAALGIAIQLVLIPPIVMAVDPAYRKKTQPTVALTTEKAAEILLSKIPKDARVAIAIEGKAAAGKTTFAKALAKKTGAAVIHTDDYLLPFDERTEERMTEIGGHFDYARLQNEVLAPWQRGDAITYRAYLCHSDEFVVCGTLPSSELLIVEGAYSHHPKLDFTYTLTVFCDIDERAQKSRILARNPDRADQFFSTWISKENAYFAATDLKNKADLSITLKNK